MAHKMHFMVVAAKPQNHAMVWMECPVHSVHGTLYTKYISILVEMIESWKIYSSVLLKCSTFLLFPESTWVIHGTVSENYSLLREAANKNKSSFFNGHATKALPPSPHPPRA